jgi:hypothetical protein
MARNRIWDAIKELDRVAATTVYNGPKSCAERVVRDLQDRGPAWTGRFSNSWQIAGPDKTSKGTGTQGNPVPIYTPPISGLQATRSFLTKNKILFTISNFAGYADQASDLAPFKASGVPDQTPLKPIEYGKRPAGGKRGQLSGEGYNRRTAPLDWFSNYVRGGALDKAVQLTMDAALRGTK